VRRTDMNAANRSRIRPLRDQSVDTMLSHTYVYARSTLPPRLGQIAPLRKETYLMDYDVAEIGRCRGAGGRRGPRDRR